MLEGRRRREVSGGEAGRDGCEVVSSSRDGPHHPQALGQWCTNQHELDWPGGLWDSQLVLDGDMHRAAAFLDKTPGNQAAARTLTSVFLCPGAHLLTAQSGR